MITVIVTDFDNTLTTVDVGDAICERFAPPAWRDIDERWLRRELPLPEAQRQMWALVRATPDEIAAFVREEARLRPGVPEFLAACRAREMPVIVASGGFDFYVEPLLSGCRDRVTEAYYSRGRPSATGTVLDFHRGLECPTCAVCKGRVCDTVRGRHPDARLVFIGDGSSDRCAVGHADLILTLAGSRLEAACRAHDTQESASFLDFFEVMRLLELDAR